MKNLNMDEVKYYVEKNIGAFHQKKIDSIKKLQLTTILKRKNPYLFKAKNILTSEALVKTILDAYLSSQEETIFGDFLEGLAIFINSKVYGGMKSSSEGIDLEFDKNNKRYIVSIKSGPNWGNSSQINKMKDNFKRAKTVLRQGNSQINVVAVNGCCYGRNNKNDRGDYFKYCGQEFWEFISGDKELYTKIIKPLEYKAKEKNDQFLKAYSQIINLFTAYFNKNFCTNGIIDWDKLVRYNSSIQAVKIK